MRTILRTILFHSFYLIAVFSLISATPVLAAANRGLSVPANQLPNELKRTDIKDYYAGSGSKQVGAIQTVIGHVVVARQGFRNAYYAASGDRLFEKDIIFTLKGSKCRFKLIGEDVAMMGENTHLGIKDYQTNQQKRAKSSVMTVAKGKAMFYALRLFKHRSNSMLVETPTAVSGVRGTKWGVEVVELPGKETASSPAPIQLADTSYLGLRILAQANPPSPPQFQTTIICFSGTVFTGSTAPPPPGALPPPLITVFQGQMTTVGSGQQPSPLSLTPTSLANSFLSGTFAPPPGDSGAPPPQPPPPGSTLLPTTVTVTTTTTLDTSTVTQQQAQQLGIYGTGSVQHEGFFVGMLTDISNNKYVDTYMSKSDGSYMNFDDAVNHAKAYASDPPYDTDPVSICRTTMYDLKVYGSAASNLPQSLQKTELGYNAYMEWGYWTQPVAMSGNFAFDNKGYYVWGEKTASLPSSFSGTFSGSAWGTLWSAAGGQNLTGSFSMTATWNGSSGSISNFSALVGTAGTNLTGISGASGSFSSSGIYNLTNGTWWVNNNSGTSGTVTGAFYGPNAKLTGGVWKVEKSGTAYANGLFIGSRP